LSATLELAVYRIVQEALTNTIRHSGAASATVAITFGRDTVAVEVTDSGHLSFAPQLAEDQPATAGHGLTGMRERARALGGTLEAGPGPDAGFRVAARLPIPSST
jgi:signal transduction histidine kinase